MQEPKKETPMQSPAPCSIPLPYSTNARFTEFNLCRFANRTSEFIELREFKQSKEEYS
jgi:hypothetical protein